MVAISFRLREIVSKARARSRIVDLGDGRRFVSHYTPAQTRAFEHAVAVQSLAAWRRGPTRFPVRVEINAYVAIPASWPIWRAEAAVNGRILPTGKPDSDNITKSILDGMNGIVYVDDAQVVTSAFAKRYVTHRDMAEGILVNLWVLDAGYAAIERDRLDAIERAGIA